MTDNDYMQLALDKAYQGVDAGQSPFAACIVQKGKVIACQHNHVFHDTDITAHGEICTLRDACKATGDLTFAGATIYSTTEPCPMCFSAIHWARIDRIVYGASIADAEAAGFNELKVSNLQLKQLGDLGVELVPGVMEEECRQLFRYWKEVAGAAY